MAEFFFGAIIVVPESTLFNFHPTTVQLETYTNASFNKIFRQPPSLESQVSARPNHHPFEYPRAIRPNSDDDHDHDHDDDEDEDDVRLTHSQSRASAEREVRVHDDRPSTPAKGGQYIRVAA